MEGKRRADQGGNAVAVRRERAQPHRGQFERDAVRRRPPRLAKHGFEDCPAASCASSLANAETISLAVAAARAGHRKGVKGTKAHRRCYRQRSNALGRAAHQLVGTRLMSFASLTIAATSSR